MRQTLTSLIFNTKRSRLWCPQMGKIFIFRLHQAWIWKENVLIKNAGHVLRIIIVGYKRAMEPSASESKNSRTVAGHAVIRLRLNQLLLSVFFLPKLMSKEWNYKAINMSLLREHSSRTKAISWHTFVTIKKVSPPVGTSSWQLQNYDLWIIWITTALSD